MSFGEETPNIGNIYTVEVLIVNPNDLYISVRSEHGSVTQQQQTVIDGGFRTTGSDEHNDCSHSSTAQMGLSHTHGVACSCLWIATLKRRALCMHVLLSTCGLCPVGLVLMREGNKNRQFLPVRTYKIGLVQRNPGNRLIHSQRKKSLRARHPSYSARIELKHRFRTAFLCRRSYKALAKSARTKR